MSRIRVFWAILAIVVMPAAAAAEEKKDTTYSQDEILVQAKGFFGETTEGLAKVVEKIFSEYGRPNAFIEGEEGSGAIGVGLRYGKGTLHRKGALSRLIYWQGPSVGFDFGGNLSKVFTLVYGLDNVEKMYQRFPGVEGSFYFVAGVGMNYQKSSGITLAPMRTGVGLRAGANLGYLHYTKKSSWNPF